jgi:sialidase-1
MAEHGITLRHGEHKGRLLRPARVYQSPAYNTAIYSDDGGKTWRCSGPFPLSGTGEGAIAELSNGHLYYSSRKHWFEKEADFRYQRPFAWSYDGGETWRDAGYHSELPDGPRYRGKQRRGFNYNGHFGMMCGLARLPVEKRDILVYSNADTPGNQRVRMTAWASFDGGKSWPVKRLVSEGPGAYSSLDAGRPGTKSEGWIYLLYEGAGATMARFNLGWLLQGEKTGDGEVPKWVTGNQ